MPKTRRNGRGSATRGWKNEQPSYRQRSVMLKKCGKKCFLGTQKSFPICKKNTCKVAISKMYRICAATLCSSKYFNKYG